MKIAFLTTDNRNMQKDYGTLIPHFGAAPEALLEGFMGMPELEVHVVSCTRVRMNSPQKLAPNIFFHSLYVPKLGWIRTGFQGCIRAVRKKLREIRPDLAHGHGTEHDCALSAVFSGFPNVVTIHGNMAELARQFRERVGSYLWLTGRLETFTLKRTLGVLCNSAYTEQLVRARARRVWRVAHALRREFFAAAPAPARSDRCRLVNVGLIAPRKRQIELLDVARELAQQELAFELLFVGNITPNSPYGNAFQERIKPLEEQGCARWIGTKTCHELVELLDAASGMVHFSPAESFGLAVAEGLARDLKLFAARVGGVADIAQGVPGAELFDVDDWRGLTAAIAGWVRRGFPRAHGAGEVMRVRYRPETIARQHLEVYREVLGHPR
ncbi:MAG TPA: glycosyltransferase family 4 protein [Verrucomicrobiota bacterium]|nr:glycosyltransferase family 4 protein [Verrucomicrobiota bacterium]HQL78236.1 glycosyltransferase family 4 protein [Verrucomicrobiota bacterium]